MTPNMKKSKRNLDNLTLIFDKPINKRFCEFVIDCELFIYRTN